MLRRVLVLLLLVVGASAAGACKSQIGDSCSSSVNCAPNGGRVCDLASPGGYCSITPCDPNGCPESAVCVEWRYEANRSSETWCMRHCSSNGDCDRSHYKCMHADEIVSADGEPLARVTDFDSRSNDGFCVYVPD